MKRITTILIAVTLLLGFASLTHAQSGNHTVTITVPSIRLLAVNGGDIAMNIQAPASAGDAYTMPANNTATRLYYTVLGTADGTKITAITSGDAIPADLALYVTAATPTGGLGDQGATANEKELTTTVTDVVDGISSCYTGTGGTDGAQLTYRLALAAASTLDDLVPATAAVVVTYTLTDS